MLYGGNQERAIQPKLGDEKMKMTDRKYGGTCYRKGHHVYFYSKKLGVTIPAVVIETKHDEYKGWLLLIDGNFPHGDKKVWVLDRNCTLQD